MHLISWGETNVTSEVKLGDFEEYAGQQFLDVLTKYSPDFRAVYSVTAGKSEEMGTAGWAGKIVHLELGVHTSDEVIDLNCTLWAVRENGQPFKTLIMKIVLKDGRSLDLIYDGKGCVRTIYLKGESLFNNWGQPGATSGLPDLTKFFVLDIYSSN